MTIKNGVYLVIEHTEAMHVIDVNSGNRTKAGKDQEENARTVNMEAAVEIARQLRLRDMEDYQYRFYRYEKTGEQICIVPENGAIDERG